jgi:hypothetical protein
MNCRLEDEKDKESSGYYCTCEFFEELHCHHPTLSVQDNHRLIRPEMLGAHFLHQKKRSTIPFSLSSLLVKASELAPGSLGMQ